MRIKVSDFIADFLADNNIRTVFSVVGGGAMHMNDSLGHHPKIRCIYNHHEQASAMAAEAYYRINNEIAACCVTSGPGAINALNGVVGAYQDSIPMIVLSGQTKTALMTVNSGLSLRTLGNQEYDIVPTLQNATKYAVTLMKPELAAYELEKSLYICRTGRPGPCWLEVPVDVQGRYIETDTLEHFNPASDLEYTYIPDSNLTEKIKTLLSKLGSARRPIMYVGNGVRISGAVGRLSELTEMFRIPVVTGWASIDLIETDNSCYVGRAGIMGDRAGNFAVQNSDLVIAVGNRLSTYQVGYNVDTWARGAYVVAVDIDSVELKKPTVRINLPICADAGVFLDALISVLRSDTYEERIAVPEEWINTCTKWKTRYPVVTDKHRNQKKPINVYAAIDMLSKMIPEGSITVVANGSASVVGSAAYYIGRGSRFIMNCALSSMGYDLPASIGACVANGENEVICIAGDGSIMMNLQELQTIVTNSFPIKIVLLNNQGYHQIRLTQSNLFNRKFVGIGPESGDLGFPDFGGIAKAFGIPYIRCEEIERLGDSVRKMMDSDGYFMLEIVCDTIQPFEPKSAVRKLENGELVSPPLEDLAPFLSRDELRENMIIDMLEQ